MNIDVAGTYVKQFSKNEDEYGSYGLHVSKHPLIQIYSTTREGNSVCVNIRDFVPYFYAPFPSDWNANHT
jgi:DNA polymerase elongation subunit (family B)